MIEFPKVGELFLVLFDHRHQGVGGEGRGEICFGSLLSRLRKGLLTALRGFAPPALKAEMTASPAFLDVTTTAASGIDSLVASSSSRAVPSGRMGFGVWGLEVGGRGSFVRRDMGSFASDSSRFCGRRRNGVVHLDRRRTRTGVDSYVND